MSRCLSSVRAKREDVLRDESEVRGMTKPSFFPMSLFRLFCFQHDEG